MNVSNLSIGEDPNISNFYLQAGLDDKVCLEMYSKALYKICRQCTLGSIWDGTLGSSVHLGAPKPRTPVTRSLTTHLLDNPPPPSPLSAPSPCSSSSSSSSSSFVKSHQETNYSFCKFEILVVFSPS